MCTSHLAPSATAQPCQNAGVPSEDPFERAIWSLASRLSGRSLAVVVVVLYAGGGLAVPLILRWPVLWLVAANVLCTVWAGVIGLAWFGVQIQATFRRHLVEWTTDLRLLDAAEFEWLVGELFRREGWTVEETGRQDGPDGNIDLNLTREGTRAIVQCKRWTSWLVDVDEVRKFAGTLLREGLPGGAGIFVTLSDFTGQARTEAEKAGLTLVNNRELFRRVEQVRRTEPCPKCHAPMRLDRSPHGWWFRCVAPGCQGKRDLGRDPGRAVDLLTQAP